LDSLPESPSYFITTHAPIANGFGNLAAVLEFKICLELDPPPAAFCHGLIVANDEFDPHLPSVTLHPDIFQRHSKEHFKWPGRLN
jgi:hypothetical protein